MTNRQIQERLAEYTQRLVATYDDRTPCAHNLDHEMPLPSQERTIELLGKISEVLYPGFHGYQHLTRGNVSYHVGALPDVRRVLILDVQAALDGDPAAKNFAEIILAYPGSSR